MESRADTDEEAFLRDVEARLRRALIGSVGADRVDDAVAEALAWAYEHRDEVSAMANPVGYLYRVGQSKVRRPKKVRLFQREQPTIPDVEPDLVGALARLPKSQRTAVWLAHGCGWTHAEIGEVMDVTSSTVATHVSRGLSSLRTELGVTDAHA